MDVRGSAAGVASSTLSTFAILPSVFVVDVANSWPTSPGFGMVCFIDLSSATGRPCGAIEGLPTYRWRVGCFLAAFTVA